MRPNMICFWAPEKRKRKRKKRKRKKKGKKEKKRKKEKGKHGKKGRKIKKEMEKGIPLKKKEEKKKTCQNDKPIKNVHFGPENTRGLPSNVWFSSVQSASSGSDHFSLNEGAAPFLPQARVKLFQNVGCSPGKTGEPPARGLRGTWIWGRELIICRTVMNREETRWKRRENREKRRWKIKSRENEEREMKRDERNDFVGKCLRTSKSARWNSPKCFEKKSLSDELFLFFLRKFRVVPFFQFFTWFEFVFSGQRINSEGVFGRTVNWECSFVNRASALFQSVYVDDIKMAARPSHTTTGLALWSSLTLETRSHRWVPAGHPQYTGAWFAREAVDGPTQYHRRRQANHCARL